MRQVAVRGGKGGPERSALGDLDTQHAAIHDIRHHLEQLRVGGGAAGDKNLLRQDLHPLRMQAHGKHLGLEHGAAIRGRIFGIQVKTVDAGLVGARDDLGFKPGQEHRVVVADRGGFNQLAERRPILDAIQLAHFFSGERTVLETDEREVVAGGGAEDVAFAVLIGDAFLHGAEEGVARTEADGDLAGLDEAKADDARGIIPGPDGGEGFGIEAVLLYEIGADRADDAARIRERRQLADEAGRGGLDGIVVPVFLPDIHQVRAGAIAEIDRGDLAREQRGHEGTDERDVQGLLIGLGIGLVKLADLRPREAFKGVGPGARGGEFDAAQFLADLGAFLRRGGIHPDGRGFTRKDALDVFDEGFFRIEGGQDFRRLLVQVNGTVLLAAAADGDDLAHGHAVFLHLREQEIERRRPHERRTVLHQRIAVLQHAMPGLVLRQRLVIIHRFFVNHLMSVEIDDDRAQALSAGVES